MADISVSVILPFYNGSRLIDTSIPSVLAQTYRTFELIIVDDGSDPGEAACLQRFNDPRIVLMRQENAGVSAARNTGIRRATGTWLAFIDQDDYWAPQKLELQVNYLADHYKCLALHTAVRRQRPDGSVAEYHKKALTLEDFLWTSPCPAYLSSTMIKRNALYRAGLFDATLRYSQDHECFMRCARLFPFHYLDEPLVTRIEHDRNLSGDKPGCWREAVAIIRQYRNEYADLQAFRQCLYTVHLEYARLAAQNRDRKWFIEILADLKSEKFFRPRFLLNLLTGHPGFRPAPEAIGGAPHGNR